jgi:hypothetical protein
MIEPIKPGDDLFPFVLEIIEGEEIATLKADWSDEKEIDLDIRTIDYWLQFKSEHGSADLISMIAWLSIRAFEIGNVKQRARFQEFLSLREQWLHAYSAA